MTRQSPPFHDLEFFDGPAFWTEGDALSRRAFLMPTSVPSEFVAFGVLLPSDKVLFVARGKVEDHLEQFISRMTQEQAEVELYVQAPVPGWLSKQYSSGEPPYEGHDYEGPPKGPVNGLVPVGTQTIPPDGGSQWPAGNVRTRRTLLVPVKEPSRFLALGVQGPAQEVCFAVTGSVQEELGNFIARMGREQSQVELHAKPPLPEPVWRKYLAEGGEH